MAHSTINANHYSRAQRVAVDAALRGISIDVARPMRMESGAGPIRASERADFTVLQRTPFDVNSRKLRGSPVWTTVFHGEKRRLAKENMQ